MLGIDPTMVGYRHHTVVGYGHPTAVRCGHPNTVWWVCLTTVRVLARSVILFLPLAFMGGKWVGGRVFYTSPNVLSSYSLGYSERNLYL